MNTSAESGRLFLAANPEPYAYDLDGNLLRDGRWNCVWDAEKPGLSRGAESWKRG